MLSGAEDQMRRWLARSAAVGVLDNPLVITN